MTDTPWETIETDVLVLGSGGAGLCAALHMADSATPPKVLMAVKGLYGKSGCTRMVQAGYNVVLNPRDSLESHFRDTLEGGQWINDQELAWRLVEDAPGRVLELENRVGCFFDRDSEGNIDQKLLAGQSFDRTVHKGDLTGIELINRLAEQVAASENTTVLEEVRALELLLDQGGRQVVGAVLLDIREGRFIVAHAKATLLATGGGPSMYKFTASSHDKSCDGMAMGYRLEAPLMDMEMVQFHPTGLLVDGMIISGTVVAESLRTAGGYLRNASGDRFMFQYDPRGEKATRDIVSRGCYQEIVEGRGTPDSGLLLDVSHLGADFVMENFPGMARRCRDVGYDLTREPVQISPTAHFMMGGIVIDALCQTQFEGLFVAGEDAGGVHGANRLGGNGVADSTVFGGIAGDVIARFVREARENSFQASQVREIISQTTAPFQNSGGISVYALRDRLEETMWYKIGLVRNESAMQEAWSDIVQIREELQGVACPDGERYNMVWMDILNLANRLDISEAIVKGALARRESRGSHFRSDFPEKNNAQFLCNLIVTRRETSAVPRAVEFSRLKPQSNV